MSLGSPVLSSHFYKGRYPDFLVFMHSSMTDHRKDALQASESSRYRSDFPFQKALQRLCGALAPFVRYKSASSPMASRPESDRKKSSRNIFVVRESKIDSSRVHATLLLVFKVTTADTCLLLYFLCQTWAIRFGYDCSQQILYGYL